MNVEARIRELVQSYLADDRQMDGVRFMDNLLALAADVGPIRCSLTGPDGLRFTVENQPVCETALGRAKSKLRMLCARLAVLCTETGFWEGTIYGGTGTIPGIPTTNKIVHPNQWKVSLINTASEQDFCIMPGAKSTGRPDNWPASAQWANSPALSTNAEKITDS